MRALSSENLRGEIYMKDVLYAVRNIRANELNKMTDELDADMLAVWKSITETIIRGTGRETTVWNLCQRNLVKIRMENLGYTCKEEYGNGPESCYQNGLRIIWRDDNVEAEETGDDI